MHAFIQGFKIGISSYKDAHKAIVKHKLWGFILIPGILSLLFFVGLIYLLVSGWESLLMGYFEELDCNNQDTIWCNYFYPWLSWTGILIKILAMMVYLSVYFFLYRYIVLIVFSPFFSLMVNKIQRKEKPDLNEEYSFYQFIKEVIRGILIVIKYSFKEILFSILTLLILLIPVVNVLQPFILWMIGAYFFGANMIDYTLEVKKLNLKASSEYTKKNKGVCLGIGVAYRIIYLIPVIGWMFAPAYAVASGYYSFNRLESND